MTLVEFVPPTPHPLWELCPQMGITDVIVKVNPDLTGLPDPWRHETLSKIVGRLKDAGLNVVGLEGDPFDMTPIKEYGAGKFLTGFTRFTGLNNLVNPVQTLEDAARHFGRRIAFIHVRDVEGTKEDFTELFHDQGDSDQFALMRVYRELGLDVPLRGDHVPEMAYDRELTPEGTPGYFTLGRLFANGYLKALMKGTGMTSFNRSVPPRRSETAGIRDARDSQDRRDAAAVPFVPVVSPVPFHN